MLKYKQFVCKLYRASRGGFEGRVSSAAHHQTDNTSHIQYAIREKFEQSGLSYNSEVRMQFLRNLNNFFSFYYLRNSLFLKIINYVLVQNLTRQ